MGHTGANNVSERRRATALANGWHVGVARFILFTLLSSTTGSAATIQAQPHAGVQHSKLHMAATWSRAFLPEDQTRSTSTTDGLLQVRDAHEHVQRALNRPQPTAKLRTPERSLQFACSMQQHLKYQIHNWRSALLTEIQELRDDMTDETNTWLNALQPHVRAAYTHTDTKQVVQVPLLLHLMDRLDLQDTHNLTEDLTMGFGMMGTLHSGDNWPRRQDSRYQAPTTVDEFRLQNREHILRCLRRPPQPQAATLLQEILMETKMGRVEGPFHAPSWWTRPAVAPAGRQLQPLPTDDPFIANAFAILQTGADGQEKVRRGEDWRRSGHNATVQVNDAPVHHTIDDFVALAQLLIHHRDRASWACPETRQPNQPQAPLHICAHDHEGA